jgi:N-acetyl-anhydromuramyl-L-alanine amidase AmpD
MKRTGTDLIVFHCSATKPSQHIGRAQIEEWHVARGFSSIGYHFVITRAGDLELGRPLEEIGAHVEGYNGRSVGVCMVGGLDERGGALQNAPNQFTAAQWATAKIVVAFLRRLYPEARVCGHRDLSPDKNHDGKIEPREWLKTCPGFDAAMQFAV